MALEFNSWLSHDTCLPLPRNATIWKQNESALVGFRGRLVFAAISLAFLDDAYGLPYPDCHNPLPLKRRFINTNNKRVTNKSTNNRRTYISRPRRELGKADRRRRRVAMALEGAAAGVHGHRWSLKADLALVGEIVDGRRPQLRQQRPRSIFLFLASCPLSSRDLVRPSAVPFFSHTHCSSPDMGSDRIGVCGGWFYMHGDARWEEGVGPKEFMT